MVNLSENERLELISLIEDEVNLISSMIEYSDILNWCYKQKISKTFFKTNVCKSLLSGLESLRTRNYPINISTVILESNQLDKNFSPDLPGLLKDLEKPNKEKAISFIDRKLNKKNKKFESDTLREEKEKIIYGAYNACEMFLRIGVTSQSKIIKELKPYFENYKNIE